MKIAKSEFCLLCDDDIVLNEDNCLERMMDEYIAKVRSIDNGISDVESNKPTSLHIL